MTRMPETHAPDASPALFVAERLAPTLAEAEAAAQALGYPVWVRSCGEQDPHFCARLDTPGDLALVWSQAARRGSGNVVMQRAVEGSVVRVWLPRAGSRDVPLVLQAGISSHHHLNIVESLVLDPAFPQAEGLLATMETLARKAGHETPWLEAEIVLSESGPLLTGLWRCTALHPAVASLCAAAAGDGAAAVVWLRSRAGKVVLVEGRDTALSQPGVVEVHIGVTTGDVLFHVVDEAARDRLGYVVAAGADGDTAESNARIAAGWVRIDTTATLD